MPKYKRTKLACYSAYFTMASVFGLPPVLLAPLHEMYGISYTLLGTLVMVNFFTQMAVGGDLGASVAPQMMGVVIDTVAASPIARTLNQSTGMTVDQIGMKAGMLTSAVFPILGVVVLLITMRYFKKKKEQA